MQDKDPMEIGSPVLRRYHVHVYTTIRIKVAVTANDHRSAMEAADRLLVDDGMPVALVPGTCWIEEAEHVDEVTGYLVDEVGDDEYRRTRSYGPDHEPDVSEVEAQHSHG